jgi:hypothetical protein
MPRSSCALKIGHSFVFKTSSTAFCTAPSNEEGRVRRAAAKARFIPAIISISFAYCGGQRDRIQEIMQPWCFRT